MTTSFQLQQNREANREINGRFAQRVRQYGSGYVDTVYVQRNKHGRNLVGYTCEFSSRQTYRSGHTLLEFVRSAFGEGVTLHKIDDIRHAVIRIR